MTEDSSPITYPRDDSSGLPAELLEHDKGRKLYVCHGSPWNRALDDYFNRPRDLKVWHMDRHYKKGDLVLTHVDTKPEMYITLEVSRHDGDGSHETPILVNHSQTVVFDKGIYGPNLARHCGFALARYGVYRGNQVRKILAAVDSELKLGTPWLTPGRWTQGM